MALKLPLQRTAGKAVAAGREEKGTASEHKGEEGIFTHFGNFKKSQDVPGIVFPHWWVEGKGEWGGEWE